MSAHAEALRQCLEAMKLVDFKDCAESAELWHKFNLAQANAERVLRDGEKQEPYAYEFGKNNGDGTYSVVIERGDLEQVSVGKYKYAAPKTFAKEHPPKPLYTHLAPSLQVVGEAPEGYALVPVEPTVEMLDAAWDGGALGGEDDYKECWALMLAAAPQPAAAPSGDVWQYDDSKKDAERLIFSMQDIDGFGGVAWDKYDYAMHFAHCNGRDEPTKEDELIGLRALIDAAITATKE